MGSRYGGYNRRNYDNYGRGGFRNYDWRGGRTGCMFCTGINEDQKSHNRSQCPVFCQLKSKITKLPYVCTEMKKVDVSGFAAAGFLLWKRVNRDVEVLMAREYRENRGDKLNFLGGQRLRMEETPIDVALRKVDIEIGSKLSRTTLKEMQKPRVVHWSGNSSKYALFLFEVTSSTDCEIGVPCAGIRTKEFTVVKRLEWTSRENLRLQSFFTREVHKFALDMIQSLNDCNVLENITDLFDTTKAPVKHETNADGMDDEGDDDGVVAAVRAKLSSIKLSKVK